MRRAMTMRIIVGLCALLAATSGASAAVWQWGCQGQIGDQQVIYNSFNFNLSPDVDPANTTGGGVYIGIFLCPTDLPPVVIQAPYSEHNYETPRPSPPRRRDLTPENRC